MLNRANLDIAKLAATDESRYTLTGILVTPNETVETDGHQLIRVSTPKVEPDAWPIPANEPPPLTDFEPFVLPASAALDAVKAIPRARGTLDACKLVAIGADTAVNGTATLITNNLERVNRIEAKKMNVDGRSFPDWQRVIPSKDKAEYLVAFDAKILANVFRAAADFDKANDGGKGVIPSIVTLRFSDPEEAVRIDIANGDQEFTGVVMPCSNDDAKAFVEARKTAKETAEREAEHARRNAELLDEYQAQAERKAEPEQTPADRATYRFNVSEKLAEIGAEPTPEPERVWNTETGWQMIDTDREDRAERETTPEPEPETPEPTPEPEPSVSALDAWLAA